MLEIHDLHARCSLLLSPGIIFFKASDELVLGVYDRTAIFFFIAAIANSQCNNIAIMGEPAPWIGSVLVQHGVGVGWEVQALAGPAALRWNGLRQRLVAAALSSRCRSDSLCVPGDPASPFPAAWMSMRTLVRREYQTGLYGTLAFYLAHVVECSWVILILSVLLSVQYGLQGLQASRACCHLACT